MHTLTLSQCTHSHSHSAHTHSPHSHSHNAHTHALTMHTLTMHTLTLSQCTHSHSHNAHTHTLTVHTVTLILSQCTHSLIQSMYAGLHYETLMALIIACQGHTQQCTQLIHSTTLMSHTHTTIQCTHCTLSQCYTFTSHLDHSRPHSPLLSSSHFLPVSLQCLYVCLLSTIIYLIICFTLCSRQVAIYNCTQPLAVAGLLAYTFRFCWVFTSLLSLPLSPLPSSLLSLPL